MQSPLQARTLADIDWHHWQAVDQATLTFIIDGEQILLIRKKRGLGAGKINGPGGRLEPGETARACAIREVQEELGVTPIDPVWVGESLFQFVDGYSIHVHTYLARAFSGTARETDEAIPLWTDIKAIPYDQMWEDDQYWLPLLLNNQSFRGRYLFDDDRMLDFHLETPWPASSRP